MALALSLRLEALKAAIAAVHPDRVVSGSCLSGVLQGYFKNSEELIGFAQNPAHLADRNDGGKLRRRELDIADIPTSRDPLPAKVHWRKKNRD